MMALHQLLDTAQSFCKLNLERTLHSKLNVLICIEYQETKGTIDALKPKAHNS